MNSLTDQQLLRDYAEGQSEAAFTEVVRRHLDLVYSAALRMVRDAQLAEDVTQGVFVAVAQNARRLTGRPVLSGWLHRTTQNLAANAVRTDVRRRAREQEAGAMNELYATEPDAIWEHITPHLDAALGTLSEAERDAVLLRYFERKSAQEMAQVLGVSDGAAQKRVSRAVERLREFFAKRGVTVGASGLVVVISANAVQAAPVGLAVTIATAATLAGTFLTTAATATTTKAIAMTTLQKTLVGAILAAAVGTGLYEAREASTFRKQVSALEQQQTALIEQLARDRDEGAHQLAAARDSNVAELARLRGEVTRLRREAQEFAQRNVNSAQPTNRLLTVAAIIVTNTAPRVLSEDQILANIKIQVGDAYSRSNVDQDVRSLYGTGLFSNIRVVENSNELGMTLTYVVKEKTTVQATPQIFENQGLATSEAAFLTFLWAAKNGDSNLIGQMLRWRKEREDAVSDELASQFTAAQVRGMVKTFSNLASVQIIAQRSDIADTTRMRVEFNESNGKTHLGEIYMIREGGDWKPAVNFSRRDGSSTMSMQYLLPTTPELGPVMTQEPEPLNAVSPKSNFVPRRTAP